MIRSGAAPPPLPVSDPDAPAGHVPTFASARAGGMSPNATEPGWIAGSRSFRALSMPTLGGSVLGGGPPRAGPPMWSLATPWRAPQNTFPKRQSPGAKEGSLYRALPETPASDISVNQQARRTQANRGHKHHRIDGALTAAQVSTPIGIYLVVCPRESWYTGRHPIRLSSSTAHHSGRHAGRNSRPAAWSPTTTSRSANGTVNRSNGRSGSSPGSRPKPDRTITRLPAAASR